MNLLFPVLRRRAFGRMARLAGAAALIAGGYGIIHDQITFTLSPEYFTEFKFHQFHWADFGLPDRVFAGIIGFLATWWVGLIAGWALGRLAEMRGGLPENFSMVLRAFAVILVSAAVFGVAGFFYGFYRLARVDHEWAPIAKAWGMPAVQDPWAFIRVGYIHNFGYAGALAGLLIAGIRVWRESGRTDPTH